MRNPNYVFICLFLVVFSRCSNEKQCIDNRILPAFVGYQRSEIDTIILRKFQAADNFQRLLDSFTFDQGFYRTSNDTTRVFYEEGDKGIVAGFDWQIFLPALNRTILISDIESNKKTLLCGTFQTSCLCFNDLFSAKVDGQTISLLPNQQALYFLYFTR